MAKAKLILEPHQRVRHHWQLGVAFFFAVLVAGGVGFMQWSSTFHPVKQPVQTQDPIRDIFSVVRDTTNEQLENTKRVQVQALTILSDSIKQQAAQQQLIQAIKQEIEPPTPTPDPLTTPE